MARIKNASKSATDTNAKAAPAKVGKIDKSAKKSAAPAKPAKEKGESAPRAPRGQFANKTIKRTDAGKTMSFRGGAAVRHDHIVSFKNTNDAIGSTYRLDGETEDRTITSADIAYLVERGAIELS